MVLVFFVVFINIVVASNIGFGVVAIEAVCGVIVVFLNIIDIKRIVIANVFFYPNRKRNL